MNTFKENVKKLRLKYYIWDKAKNMEDICIKLKREYILLSYKFLNDEKDRTCHAFIYQI